MILAGLAVALSVGSPWIGLDRSGPDWFVKDHRRFFSFGVDCVGTGVEPDKDSAQNPAYSALKLFPDEAAWAHTVQSQLASWGFNSLGAWSDVETFRKWCGNDRMPYAVCLHLGAYDQAPWHDIFADQMRKAMDGAARDQIPKFRDDPFLIGYFSDNELGWWDDTLFKFYLSLKSDAPGHRALVRCLRKSYRDNMSALKEDWVTTAASFEEIRDMKLRPGRSGRLVVKQWAFDLASHYYRLAHDLIRKYDPNHLILGDRYAQYYSVPVVKASVPFVDVVSSNLGADWNDGSQSPFYLNTLHSLTGKPVMITEFYMTAMENRSGDKNNSDGFPVVQTQQERAVAFSRYVKAVSELPFVVGAHWFQYADEPGNGRGDGENYNMGLVDIHGVPYDEITAAAKSIDVNRCHARSETDLLPAGNVPGDPYDGLKEWDRRRCYVRPESSDTIADLYVMKRADGLYIGLYCMDYVDRSLYAGNQVPEIDRCRLRVWLKGTERPIDVRFGGGKQITCTGRSGCGVKSFGGLKTTTILFIPGAKEWSRAEFETHGRAESASWRG